MYTLMIVDAVVRVIAALAFLFIAVPALAWRRPAALDRLEWFWFCFASGLLVLVIVGQVLTLVRSFTAVPLLLTIAALIVILRGRLEGTSPGAVWGRFAQRAVPVALNVMDGRVDVRRRIRRVVRRTRARLRDSVNRAGVGNVLAWTAVIGINAFFRLLRPFTTANLGYSDVYAHLYLMRLLQQGVQVDVSFGPYPRGMHFLIVAIQELTNADLTLLTNSFGPVIGILLAVSVADAARRLVGAGRAALLTAALIATTVGGPTQYFVFGGAFQTGDMSIGKAMAGAPYGQYTPETDQFAGPEFDVLLYAFQRLALTYPQELALVFLFPAAMFLLKWFRTGQRWQLAGYIACCAAISAVHSGVVIPLIVLSAVSAMAAASEGVLTLHALRRAVVAGLAAIVAGSSWALGYLVYGFRNARIEGGLIDAIGYYFPFLRPLTPGRPWLMRLERGIYVPITPFLAVCVGIAVILLVRACLVRREWRGTLVWVSAATLLFFYVHIAARFNLPKLLPVNRNVEWFALTLALLITVAAAEIAGAAARLLRNIDVRRAYAVVGLAVVVLWCTRVPNVWGSEFRRLHLDQTGYNLSSYAVLRIKSQYQPYTWTLVTYGQEFPLILGSGFHIPASEFLARYDPSDTPLRVPTKYVFIVVEKNPHRFQVTDWARRFSRADIEQRLQTWCYLYQLSHRNITVYLEDANVRVYKIELSSDELRQLAERRR